MKAIDPKGQTKGQSPWSRDSKASGGGDWGSGKQPHKTHGQSSYKGGTKGVCRC